MHVEVKLNKLSCTKRSFNCE